MSDYYKTAQARYMNAAPETRKASREHWTKTHTENMKSGSPDAIAFSASILAAYDVADAYLEYRAAKLAELEQSRKEEREKHAQRPLWDGKGPDGKLYEDRETVEYWDMRTDEAGNICYLTWDSPRRVNIWCTAEKLLAHLRRNAAIMGRA